MPSISSWAYTLLLLASTASALPNGAPKCAINPAVITKEHEAASTAGGYKMVAGSQTYTPGQTFEVTISGTLGIAGVLMYATPGTANDATAAPNNSKQHVGKFSSVNGFRAQTASACAAAGIANDAPESTITHANAQDKGKSIAFTWTAPATNIGPVTFNAAIANGSPGKPWQVVDILTVQPVGGGGTPPSPAPAPTNLPAPPATPAGGKKCLKKNKSKRSQQLFADSSALLSLHAGNTLNQLAMFFGTIASATVGAVGFISWIV
ncbi:hypothetical protein DFS34DRAFT_648616 [Phlyctochytrium arcticum]|nr:hypothetical protein DFS34DRAFT_648616 [Phlyctochytrium arcticum]